MFLKLIRDKTILYEREKSLVLVVLLLYYIFQFFWGCPPLVFPWIQLSFSQGKLFTWSTDTSKTWNYDIAFACLLLLFGFGSQMGISQKNPEFALQDPWKFRCEPRETVLPACRGPYIGFLRVRHAWNAPSGSRPGSIRDRYPSHLTSSMWRSIGSCPSSSRVTELLTMSLTKRPQTILFQLKVISKSSWP